jgi:hypothetical protein
VAVRELTGGLIGVCEGAGWRIGKDLGRGSVNRTFVSGIETRMPSRSPLLGPSLG